MATYKSNKKAEAAESTTQAGDQTRIIRGDANMRTVYANVAQVKATREEIMLLFGTSQARGQNETLVQLKERILLGHVAAKRLSILLNNAIKEYESKFGPLDMEAPPPTGSDPKPSLRLPYFKSRVTAEKVGLLFQLLENLDLRVSFERSFKLLEKTLLGSRFLLGINKNTIRPNPHEKILDICIQMDMPKNILDTFQINLPEANMVLFGFEENETTCIVKAYLEFGSRYDKAIKNKPDKPDPYLSHLGFKWDAADNTRSALTRYTCFPAFTVKDMLERLSNSFYRHNGRNPFEIIKGILDLASSKVGHDKFLYLDVSEGNNPRSSFDINMYGANLRMKELHPFLLEMCRHYSIPDEQFHNLYELAETQIFGHLAGGMDRKGRDFLTIYFGE